MTDEGRGTRDEKKLRRAEAKKARAEIRGRGSKGKIIKVKSKIDDDCVI
jgi:hypothetical protein